MADSLPPEWRSWVQENLGVDPGCGLNLFLKLMEHCFDPVPALNATGDFDLPATDPIVSIENAKICVLIASYRDPECAPTIEDLFLKARRPDRIRVAVLSQEDKEGKLALPKSLHAYRQQIVIN